MSIKMHPQQAGLVAGDLAEALGGRKTGNGWLARCPAHDDRTPSLTIGQGRDGQVLLHCFAGCDYKEIIDALHVGGLWRWRRAPKRVQRRLQEPTKQDIEKRLEALRTVWQACEPIKAGDPVDIYLRGRGLSLTSWPQVLRHHPALPYWDGGECLGEFPAMVALVVSATGQPVSVHRTYLAADGQKAPVPEPKKLMRPIVSRATRGAAIRLHEPVDTLGLAEGIETALAVHAATSVPAWATISSSGMQAIRLPDVVSKVDIWADRDRSETGERAAEALASRLQEEGRLVRVLIPPVPIRSDTKGVDWLDVLNAKEGCDD